MQLIRCYISTLHTVLLGSEPKGVLFHETHMLEFHAPGLYYLVRYVSFNL